MTDTILKAQIGKNPILRISRDENYPLSNLRELRLSSKVYKEMSNCNGTKLEEVLPNCLANHTELWSCEDENNIKLVYIVEKSNSKTYQIRMIQKTDLKSNKFEEYVYPQKECEKGVAFIL